MDLNEIKNFRPSNGEKYILIEDGKPTVVLLSFEDYKKICYSSPEKQKKLLEAKEAVVQEQTVKPEEVEELKQELRQELTLEDLPF